MKPKTLHVVGTKIMWKDLVDGWGPQTSWDSGEIWHFTFRGEKEFREMYRNNAIIELGVK